MRRRVPAGPVATLAASLLMAACGSAPPPVAAPADAPAPPAPSQPPAIDSRLADFERQQTERATAAEGKGHWAQAALNWEVLTLVNPDDPSHRARWAEAKRQADRLAAERQATAEAAQRRGDLDGATRAWLEALALDPGRTQAADALRQIERERTRRATVGRFAANAAARRSGTDAPTADASEQGRSANSVREHASMLVQQGDFDGAIQTVRDASQPRGDAGLRALLADLYVQKAESMKQRQPEAARTAVEAALAIDRRHAGALALQQQLPPPRPRASPPTSPPAAPPSR